MIAAQFSREDMIRYAGWEEGMEEGREKGLKEGLEQGLERGLEQGIEQGLRNIVCNMYARNYTIGQISSIAEISEEKVKEILNLG